MGRSIKDLVAHCLSLVGDQRRMATRAIGAMGQKSKSFNVIPAALGVLLIAAENLTPQRLMGYI